MSKQLLPVASEHDEQVAFVNWFRLQFPGVLIYSVPNGSFLAGTVGKRVAQMARLKAEGLVVGVPDLHVPAWRLYIEMKREKGGRLSKEQCALIDDLLRTGCKVIVGYGWQDAKASIQRMIAAGLVQP